MICAKSKLWWSGLTAGLLVMLVCPLGCGPDKTSCEKSGTCPGEKCAACPAAKDSIPKASENKVPVAKVSAKKTDGGGDAGAVLDSGKLAGGKIIVPLGLPPVPVPADNPMSEAKIALGKKLYFDTRLSADGTLSCATCHDPDMAWAETEPTSTGIKGQLGVMNSPSIINSAYATSQFWDGRAASLEEQALGPIENPVEMGHKLDTMINDLNNISEYKEEFQKVFGTGVSKDGVAKAIAAFERTVLSGNAPYDRFVAGDAGALSDSQKRGMELFEESGCSTCHTPPLFSNFRFYNAGIGMDKTPPHEGRKAVTGKERDLGKFRVPMLREVEHTAPYFHDGSVATLEEAVSIMADGGKNHPKVSFMLKAVGENKLSNKDRQDLAAFMKALSGEYPKNGK